MLPAGSNLRNIVFQDQILFVDSDRGFQYTSAMFSTRLKKHHMKQSMSHVAHCIDNGPMEGFWGILKRETYYGRKFNEREALVKAIEKASFVERGDIWTVGRHKLMCGDATSVEDVDALMDGKRANIGANSPS